MIRILLIFLVITYISFSNNTKKQDEEYIPINGIKKDINIQVYTLKNKESKELVEILKGLTNVKISGIDKKILLKGSENEVLELIEIIKNIDIPKEQVLIKATILDTSKNLFDRLGFKWKLNTKNILSNILSGETTFTNILQNAGDILDVDIDALKENGDISIKAIPSIVVLDNGKGIFKITEEIMVGIKNSTKKNSNEPIFKEAGLILNVTPKIKGSIYDKYIELDIKIEISNFKIKSAKKQNIINTTINIQNGKSMFIGGNTQLLKEESKSKTPILSDIPFLGMLFTYTTSNNVERELYIEIEAKIL